MQTINGFLKTNGVTAIWCDKNGQTAETPSITVGMCCRFRIAIFRDEIDENGDLIPVSFEEMQGAEILEKYTNSALALDVYNGAGPDSWIPAAREILTKAMSLFSPAVLIHDAQYTESNGSREDFEETVRCWTVNTRKIFDAEFPLWTLKMLKRTYRVERAYWWGVMKTSNAAIATETAFEAYQAAARQ